MLGVKFPASNWTLFKGAALSIAGISVAIISLKLALSFESNSTVVNGTLHNVYQMAGNVADAPPIREEDLPFVPPSPPAGGIIHQQTNCNIVKDNARCNEIKNGIGPGAIIKTDKFINMPNAHYPVLNIN